MLLQFDPVYLHSTIDSETVSRWESQCNISCSYKEFIEKRVLVLPPMSPTPLKVYITCHLDGKPLDSQDVKLFMRLFQESKHFWDEQLLYQTECTWNDQKECIQLNLTCKIWNSNKMTALLAKPTEYRPHIKLPVVAQCTCLNIDVNFHYYKNKWSVPDIISHFNEYMGSLFVSQLEFQFPMVFSIIARNRFKSQEADIGPISYGLTHSSALLPIAVELIAYERTATTAYQLVRPKHQTSRMNFQILVPRMG